MFQRFHFYAWVVGLIACVAQVAWAQQSQDSGTEYLDFFGTQRSTNTPAAAKVETKAAPRVETDLNTASKPRVNTDRAARSELKIDAVDAFVAEKRTFDLEANLDFDADSANLLLDSAGAGAGCDQCGQSDQSCCDCKKQKALAKAAAKSHKIVFWNNNFNYLCDPCYDDYHLGDDLKRMCFGDNMVLDIGGSYRLRYHNERNMRGLGLTGRDDSFILHQTRIYGNLEIGDRYRVFAEMIDAVSDGETFAPRPIEEDRADMLNLFIDFTLFEGCRGDLSGRIGRQELIYGNQRLVSPLPWGNT